MTKLPRPITGRQLKINDKISINIALLLFPLFALLASPLQAADVAANTGAVAANVGAVQIDTDTNSTPARVTQLSQAATDAEDEILEEVIVTGTQIKGAAISEALPVSVFSSQDIEMMGISSGDELLEAITEQGQNFQNEAENISGGVNSVRGDIGAFNLRNMGTGNTLAFGRR